MAAFLSRIALLDIWKMGGNVDPSSIFIHGLWSIQNKNLGNFDNKVFTNCKHNVS